jgi:ATP-binding cassette subfamily A (ABC1) protein 3
MLTGMTSPDASQSAGGTMVYGSSIFSEMDQVRMSMGVCPQHDVLFEGLSVREHIMFFAQLKGASLSDANEEAVTLTTMFHLEERMDHLGNELSGGQRRKLSVAIAVCGGSKFVVLDEPTAGMDPLARRELWDLLASLRKGRTMLLTTHYMDEADVLGDRVGIMSLGQMQCMGST